MDNTPGKIMSETSSSVSSSSCAPSSSSTLSEKEWLEDEEEDEEECVRMVFVDKNNKTNYSAIFTCMVFEVDKIIYDGGGLQAAQNFLNLKIQNGQFSFSNFLAPVQNLHTLIPFLLLADVESRLGSVWSSNIATILMRKILEDFLSLSNNRHNNEDHLLLLDWIYWSQKLELKILQRARAFDLCREVTLNFCADYKAQRELERDAISLNEDPSVDEGDSDYFENCKNNQTPAPWSWTRLVVIGDLLAQARRFEGARTWYEKARDKIVDKSALQPVQQEGEKFDQKDSDNFFKVENRIIKLFIKMRLHAEALELALPLLTRLKNIFGENSSHYTILKTLYHISLLYKCQGNYRRALEFAESLSSKTTTNQNDDPPPNSTKDSNDFCEYLSPKILCMVDLNMAELRLFLKKPSLALARGHYVEAFRSTLITLGETHPIVLDSMTNIAKWFMSKKNLDKDVAFALRFLERVHKIQKEMWGEEDPETKATGEYIGQGGTLPSLAGAKSMSMTAKGGGDNSGTAVEKKGRKLGAYWDKLKKKRRDGMVAAVKASASDGKQIVDKVSATGGDKVVGQTAS